MSTLKDFRFLVSAAGLSRRRVRLTAEGKSAFEVAMPPEFRGGTAGMWSPEELLLASVASCYLLTLEGIAAHRNLELRGVNVEGVGHVTRRAEGRVGFVVIELRVELVVDDGEQDRAEHIARAAKQSCLVAHALEVPVELEVRTTIPPRRIPVAAGD